MNTAYVLFNLVARENGKTDKVPVSIEGLPADAQNPANWLSESDARGYAQLLGPSFGVGIVITPESKLFALDLDGAHDGTAWASYVQPILDAFPNAYTEVSVSGRGLHVIGSYRGARPLHGTRCAAMRSELYTGGRFIALGKPFGTGSMSTDCTPSLNWLLQWFPHRGDAGDVDGWTTTAREGYGIADDAQLVERAKRSTSVRATFGGGISFAQLWDGDLDALARAFPPQTAGQNHDGSAADLALCNHTCFWSGGNMEQMARLLRASGLQRPKHSRDDYIRSTVSRACAGQTQWYAERSTSSVPRTEYAAIGQGDADSRGKVDVARLRPPTMTLDEMRAQLVHIPGDKNFTAFLDRPAFTIPTSNMAALLKHNLTAIPKKNPAGRKVAATLEEFENAPTFGLWQSDAGRITVQTLGFDPRMGNFYITDEGKTALNLWRERPHNAPADWAEHVRPFLDHVEYLIPVGAERARFLDWLAHIEQQPGELPHSHFLMITPTQGTGRGWLTSALACVFAGYTALGFKLGAMLKNGFNGELSRKLLAVVDEINEGSAADRHKHETALNDMTTERERAINPKYGLQHTEVNCCRFLLCSNYETAIAISDNDRRWNVVRNPSTPRSPAYYQHLYGLINPKNPAMAPFVASVREFLRQRDLAGFNPGEHAIRNEAKQAVVAASRSDADERAAELVREHASEVIKAADLYAAVFGYQPVEGTENTARNWKVLGKIAADARIVKLKTIKRGGQRYPCWALRNADAWKAASLDAIAEAVRAP